MMFILKITSLIEMLVSIVKLLIGEVNDAESR